MLHSIKTRTFQNFKGGFTNMKNLKKLLAVALSLAILLTLTVPVMAATLTNAEKVELLGILQGEGNGVTDEYLAKATTRIQGAVLLLRLIGKEDEALAYAGGDNFTDVVGNEWFHSLTAYLKANPQYGFGGYDDGSFKPLKVMTGAEFYKVLLTILGYVQGTDYTWAEVAAFAEEKGLVALEDPTAGITNADIADAILEALQAEMKSGVALLDSLIADGIISAADANAAGLIEELGIVSAVPTNADEITVTFSKPVEGSPAISVKSGLMNIYVSSTWNAAKTQVVLKRANSIPFTAGTYDLKVGDLTAAVKFEKEVAQSIAISKATFEMGKENEFEIILYNQYGKKMNAGAELFTATAFNKSAVSVVNVSTTNNKLKITADSATKENHILVVTVMHNATTLIGQAEVTAVNASKVTQFAMTEVVIPEKATMVNTTHTNVEIKYQAFDQYGNAMVLKDFADVTSGTGLTFISSNTDILDVASMKFDSNGKLLFTPKNSGTVTLSVLVNSAAVVTSLPITVYDPAAVNNVVIGEALKEVVEDETTEISFVALDQFGNELEKKNVVPDKTNGLSFQTVGALPAGNFDIKDGVLTITPDAGSKGYTTVYYYYKEKLLGSFTLNVWAKAVPTSITDVTLNAGVELGATQPLAKDKIIVLDQYGRVYKDIKANNKPEPSYEAIKASASDIFEVATTEAPWSFKALKEGTTTYTIQLVGKPDSAYSFTLKGVDVEKAATGMTYTFASVPTLYSGKFADAAAAGSYAKEMSLSGKTADGTVVFMKPGKIHALVSSNNVNIAVDGLKIYSKVDSAQTTILRAYDITGKLLAQADVNATKGRAAAKVELAADKSLPAGTYALTDEAFGLKVTDQYSVNLVAVPTVPVAADNYDVFTNGFFAISDPAKATLNADNTITFANPTDGEYEITLTYVTNTGLSDSIVITVTVPAV